MKRILIYIISVGILITGSLLTEKKDNILSRNLIKKVQVNEKSTKNNDEKKKQNEEKTKKSEITIPSVSQNDEKLEENSTSETKKSIQNDTNISSNTTSTAQSSPVVNESISQNNTQQNVVQEERPQVDPNTTDTSHYLYSMHHGIITKPSYSECQDAGYSVQRTYPDKNLSHSCYEVYNISGGIKGYYLDVTEDGRDANYLKSSLGLN